MIDVTEEKVRELLNQATPGPWEALRDTFSDGLAVCSPRFSGEEVGIPEIADRRGCDPYEKPYGYALADGDARIIAAAPEIAQAYLDKCEEIENLWREIADGSVHP